MEAETLLKEGRLEEALAKLQESIRAKPADAKLRVFLFQMLCVLGQWERAMTQLNVAAEMDAVNLLMAEVCRPALNCEVFRAEVFAGKRLPLVLGEPQHWLGLLIQANQLLAQGQTDKARAARESAFEAAPAVAGSVDGRPFEWIADADSRLGPVLETIIDGRYYWLPFANISVVQVHKPEDLRDVVWAPANITLSNGGQKVALIPGRYPGSESDPDASVRLGRATVWRDAGGDAFVGLGQRVLATDSGENGLLEVRRIVVGPEPAPAPE